MHARTVAKAFYATVFNWKFLPHPSSTTLAEDDFAMFTAPGKEFPQGGIMKKDPAGHTKGQGAVKIFLYVHDLEKKMEVSFALCPLFIHHSILH